ncbi:damage-inducible protein DinB [Cellulophaga sp. HaHaR_3_176]|uniref:DinB family protein n=1 Tax=Cellulophaga sp. HaHaR_3_176 TaxID=1942464 RepID=UPI001C1F8CBB|nr:DinB family protein [Cellulophaga sp. HaHaR_3_176]QWX85183.1 damage-inducible protein DinB [Cellulophaga sp. HaHaR_3_176]
MKLNEILLNEFKDEMNTTRKFLNSISEDVFEFTPHEKSKKMGELANHILPISSWIPAITQNSELDWSTAPSPAVLNSKEAILKQFEENIIVGEKALEATNNDQLMESWTMRNADTVMFSGTKETAIRRYVLSHTVHHRAQLGVYLRLNNIKVPASYVASADEVLF